MCACGKNDSVDVEVLHRSRGRRQVEVDNEEVFHELRCASENRARAVDDHAVAVEDQVILPTHNVYVGDNDVCFRRPAGDQREPNFVLVAFKWRGIDHDEQTGFGVVNSSDRPTIPPQVFANDQGNVDALHL